MRRSLSCLDPFEETALFLVRKKKWKDYFKYSQKLVNAFFSKNLASSRVKREKEGIPTPNAKHLRTIIPAVFIFVYAHEFEERIENTVNID